MTGGGRAKRRFAVAGVTIAAIASGILGCLPAPSSPAATGIPVPSGPMPTLVVPSLKPPVGPILTAEPPPPVVP